MNSKLITRVLDFTRYTLLITAVAIGLVGCATTPSGPGGRSASDFAPILAAAASDAVIYAHQKDPHSAAYIAPIADVLEQLLLSNDPSPAKLSAAIRALPFEELHTPEAQLIITPILAAYGVYADHLLKESVANHKALCVLLQALLDGLKAGQEAIK